MIRKSEIRSALQTATVIVIIDLRLALDATCSVTRAHQTLGAPSHSRQLPEITEPTDDKGASGQLVGSSVALRRGVS